MIPNDKSILITGGSGGIGTAIATALTGAGYPVIVNYHTSGRQADETVTTITQAGGSAWARQCDISDSMAVSAMIADLPDGCPPIYGMVHCAALPAKLSGFSELTWNDFQTQLDIQIKGAVNITGALLPGLLERGEGSIIFIGSTAADGVPPARQTEYVVAKSALNALARCLAVEFGPKGIRVNTISPGITATQMIANLPEKAVMVAKMQTPLRRIAEPEDIANVVSFLIGPAGRHITGENIRVAGGASMS